MAEILNQPNDVDLSLNELTNEASALFKVIDQRSADLIKLENALNEANARLPYKYLVTHYDSHIKVPTDIHRMNFVSASSYYTRTSWYLAWEADDKTKKYRLFLIAEDEEIVNYGNSYYKQLSAVAKTQYVFKKALSETNYSLRRRYLEHLIPFMDSLKANFKKSRIAIEKKLTF